MSLLYRCEGIVIRTTKLGEADKIVTVATKERGKVRGVAKGVRKTSSRFGGRLEPISHVALQLYEGRNLDTITQVETVDAFGEIRQDFDRIRRGLSLLEAVDGTLQEGEPSPRLFQMLVGALRELERNDSPLIVASFFWKLLALDGVRPLLDQCASCGVTENLVAFDMADGGVLCSLCRHGMPIGIEALGLMQRILGGDLARVLREPPGNATFEVEHLADVALEQHLERRLRSRHLLDRT